MHLALFDLDHTLVSGDSDALWCEFLVERGLLAPAYREHSREMAARYDAGTVAPTDFYAFYAGLLIGRSTLELLPLRQQFFDDEIRPRISDDARDLLQRHRSAGDMLLLTTATNRVVSEFTAAELGVDHYLCTELEVAAGRYTGRAAGVLNMRAGKIERLRQWLQAQGLPERLLKEASFYSDSINDLALLSAVGRPVVVDPDPRLESTALRKGWKVLRLDRSPATGRRSSPAADRGPA